ncbi:MAG: hypothetical protein WCB46_04095 [Methanoregula sp.]
MENTSLAVFIGFYFNNGFVTWQSLSFCHGKKGSCSLWQKRHPHREHMQPNAYCDGACQHPPTGDGGKKHHFYSGENLVFSSSMMPSSCATRIEEPDDSSTVSYLMRFYISKNPLDSSLVCSLKRAAFPKGTGSIAMHGYLFLAGNFRHFLTM